VTVRDDVLPSMRVSHARLLRAALVRRERGFLDDAEKLEDAAAEIREDIRHHERRALMVIR